MTMATTRHQAQQEVARLLQRIRMLAHELRTLERRGGPDADLKERELERLRWRLAAIVRESEAVA
jgi:hypothetical protein